jgi:peptidoglycan/LPS O-acetylase OafA/YrhL
MTRSAIRITQLDGIRGFAIIAVFLHHAFGLKLLWSGVDLFFVLSGLLITGILLQQKKTRSLGSYLGHFYERRARRILSPYLLLLTLTTIFFGVAWLSHVGFYIFLMNMLKWLQ